MALPWKTLDVAATPDGPLELRRRGDRDFLILINNRVLMNSSANRSELALGEQACRMIASRPRPRVLIGGLGMGLTLRASLDVLPPQATVVVAELNPIVLTWCRKPLAALSHNAVDDPRVSIEIADVATVINKASHRDATKFDAIVIDLYEGPGSEVDAGSSPFYGTAALERTAASLAPAGIFGVWGENPDAGFERRLVHAGFTFQRQRPGRGGLRHVIYLASLK